MPSPPHLSIVTAADERCASLARTIESVLSQSQPDCEYFVVWTGDEDSSESLRARYAGRLTWIDRPGLNQVAAINVGLAESRGAAVAWLNAGDVYYRESLTSVARLFQERPEIDVLFGDAVLFDDLEGIRGQYRTRTWSRARLRRRCCLCQPAVFLRRRWLDTIGPLEDGLRHWADYDWWLRLDAAGARFERTPQLLAGACIPVALDDFFGPFPRDRSVEAASELNDLYRKHFGKVPSRWLAHAGRVVARRRAERERVSGTSFVKTLLHARKAARRWNNSGGLSSAGSVLLTARTIREEWRSIKRHPKGFQALLPENIPGRIGSALNQRIVKPALSVVDKSNGGLHARLADWLQRRIVAPAVSVADFTQTLMQEWVSIYARKRIFKLRHHRPRPLKLPGAYARTAPPADAPLISIVTPNLNQGPFLEATLKSVLDQEYPRTELIVQDGGSRDESLDILRQYAPRLKHWVSERDKGQSHAINLGMRHATGEIMAYLNSDDVLLPGSLAYVARFFHDHPDVDAVYGHRVLIDEQGRDIGRWVLPPHDDDVLSFADYVPQETLFWRRRIWDKVGGGLDESFQFAMDWDLILRFRDAGGRFRRLPRFLGAFRISDSQKTSQLLQTTGRRDMDLLRQRVLGHVPTNEEIRSATRRYLQRHWLCDKLYLAGVLRY